jgi:hypothetical protein
LDIQTNELLTDNETIVWQAGKDGKPTVRNVVADYSDGRGREPIFEKIEQPEIGFPETGRRYQIAGSTQK